ncbi:hypothetical protein CYMTET_2686 [Cymbomonas tetramitiformis]|uniref:Uncharacterized protein n=1 Tax=Cymbomonas tetramitiformis TaxID=36881 RepID=A0AAE0LLJ7_9CHLO|nr:hypothetical protein CYMTET_2686 [Cymbomonas tetramitiformis]
MVANAMAMREILPELFLCTALTIEQDVNTDTDFELRHELFEQTRTLCLDLIGSIGEAKRGANDIEALREANDAHKRAGCLLAFKLLETCGEPPSMGSPKARMNAVMMRFAERGSELAVQFATIDSIVEELKKCALMRGNVVAFGSDAGHAEQRKFNTERHMYKKDPAVVHSYLDVLQQWSDRIQDAAMDEYKIYAEAKKSIPAEIANQTRPCADSDYVFACLFSQLPALFAPAMAYPS